MNLEKLEQAYNTAYTLLFDDNMEGYELKYIGDLNGEMAFSCEPSGDETAYTGFPLYMLVKGDVARFSSREETERLMKMESQKSDPE